MSPNLATCAGCGRTIDLDEGAGSTDEAGRWWHEDCADARDENAENEPDTRD